MSFVAAAIGGAGLLSAGASIYGSNKQSDAANQAAAIQRQAMQFQKQNYDTASGNLSPFIETGKGANSLLGSLYGLNGSDPSAGTSALAQFAKSPDYQFALSQGSAALDNSAAARGGVLGGNQILAQTKFGQGLATQNLNNYLTRLSGMSQQGITAGGYLGQIGTGVGNSIGASASGIGKDIMGGATAQAAGINGVAGAFNQGLSNYLTLSKSSYGGNGFNNPSYGGGNFLTDAYGGSASNPLQGLTAADYGI